VKENYLLFFITGTGQAFNLTKDPVF